MKKFVLAILTAVILLCCVGLTACRHEHNYDQKSTKAIYRKTMATCGTSAVYYKSCTCGEMGTEIFDAGSPLGHSYVNRECIRCHSTIINSEGLIYQTIDEVSCIVYSLGSCSDFDVVIPAAYDNKVVVGIKDNVFNGYDDLESVTIPNSILSIGKNAFSGCINLKQVIFAEDSQLKTIEESAFEGCSKLTVVSLPSLVKTINRAAFSGCINLEEVSISNSVTNIGAETFKNCIKLSNLTIPNSVQNIGDSAFENCGDLEKLTIPSSVETLGSSVFSKCSSLTKIELDGNQNFKVVDGNLYSKDGKTLLQYAIGKSENSFVVPEGVTKISEKAFCSSINLVSITLPKTLESIGSDAFQNCNNLLEVYNLSTLDIQKGSEKNGDIGHKARDIFNSLNAPSKLKMENGFITYKNGQENLLVAYIGSQSELTIPSGVTKIEDNVFEGNTNLQSITFSNSVTAIGKCAFSYCNNLKSVTMEKSVKSIDWGAFLGCSKLISITYNGTKSEWNNIEKGGSWDFSTPTYMVTCSDGAI